MRIRNTQTGLLSMSCTLNFPTFSTKAILLLLITLSINSFAQDGFIPGKPALAYWSVGNKAETVIMLHGGPAAAHKYLRPEFDALKKVAKVIYYDQRGCGASDTA